VDFPAGRSPVRLTKTRNDSDSVPHPYTIEPPSGLDEASGKYRQKAGTSPIRQPSSTARPIS
jgi:hypothetical protein